MNYPYRKAVIDYILGADNGEALVRTVMTIAENYPKPAQNVLMNILSTHDTERILTVFSPTDRPSEKEKRAGGSKEIRVEEKIEKETISADSCSI